MEETMRTFTCLTVTAFVLVVPFSASRVCAGVYRCVLEGGHISYQQIPCSDQSQPMEFRDPQSGWSPLRPGERNLLKSYRAKDAARRRKSTAVPKVPAKDSQACWKKRTQLEAVRSKLHLGYRLKEGAELRRQRDNYEDYLRRFCP
jgi:hypothetical protein